LRQAIGKILVKISGWKRLNDVPAEAKRCVFVFAPHTSNWDWYYGTINMFAWGLPIKVAIKNFWTKFPLGLLIKPLGGVGIDRSKKANHNKEDQVNQLAALFDQYDEIAFTITPEGTRSLRTKWKTGFFYIAHKANVPIVMISANCENKTVKFGPVLDPQSGLDQVMKDMMNFFSDAVAFYPENFSIDERYA